MIIRTYGVTGQGVHARMTNVCSKHDRTLHKIEHRHADACEVQEA